ncbi:adenylate/guanylate cyclase domain-containing protein [Micromonospora carbonacea]|uniref:AAA family ATPase n=1 Tax=Micromonospora carbonacea TaxID=47853 RepID=A0A7H8XKN3_9ACTN|nr:adenylate/guanylate cyclase domain-containing protein [Micromonospora carbonacea]MBB5825969.1 class 3 adenylate cyclase/tetratricopeptide (TPR) repeat protein [Micromonospora carbonacea]QLD25557.1 AAA family ATPase [Micromonospora carbonacea]
MDAPDRRAEERRVVTVLFCDLVGSTELAGALDPELLRMVLLRYYDVMSGIVAAGGGVVEKFIGDAVMAVFGLTETREDDARLALVAALGMTEAAAKLDAELWRDHGVRLRVRIGVHTGEVVALPDPARRHAFVSGEVVNIAARLEQAAAAGQVLISSASRAAAEGVTVTDGRSLALKGVAAPVEAFRLVHVPPPDPRRTRRFDVPFVGREAELSLLDDAWRRVAEAGNVGLLTVLGEAGIGKTRLIVEWLCRRGSHAAAELAIGRCRPAGDGGTLTALGECIASLAAEADHLAAVALLRRGLLRDGTPAPSVDATCKAVMQVVATVAMTRPVALVLDDCQWAQPALVGMLERLATGLRGLPVLLLCVARPDLPETFATWSTTTLDTATVLVNSLPVEDSTRLVAHLAEVSPHDQASVARMVDQAGGNPLYLEQLVATADQDTATADALPLSLHAMVAARIDRLGEQERLALRIGSLVDPDGNGFGRDDVGVMGPPLDGDCRPVLAALVNHRLVEPAGDGGFRIPNGITRQVAYGGLTKRRRGELHERYAEHLIRRGGPDSLVGGHLARAHRYQSAVGITGDQARGLRRRAFHHLFRAGAGALHRMDLPWALALLEQAVELSEPGDPGRPECLERLGEVHLTQGTHDQAKQALTTAETEAGGSRPVAAAHARLNLAVLSRDAAALDRVAASEFAVFTAHGDDRGLARVRLILAQSRMRQGRYEQALEVLDPALRHAVAAGTDREVANALGATGLALWRGPIPAGQATQRCRTLLAAHRDHGGVQATLGFPLTVLYASQARMQEAVRALAETQEAMAGMSYAESHCFRPLLEALVAVCRNETGRARDLLREALVAANAVRADALVRQTRLELARVCLAQADPQSAGEQLSGLVVSEDDLGDLANLLGLAARVEAHRDPGGSRALELGRLAVGVARRTDSPIDQGRALLDLAQTHVRLDRPTSARLAASAAASRYAAKEHVVGQMQARRLVSALGVLDGTGGRWAR